LYSERLLQHFHEPRHSGLLSPPAVRVDCENPACGDRLTISARIEDGCVAEAAFLAMGCTASIACGSALAGWLRGRTLADLAAADVVRAMEDELGPLPQASRHAAVLAADAVRALISSQTRRA
jgi:nitrogen fixation NifU-like protein